MNLYKIETTWSPEERDEAVGYYAASRVDVDRMSVDGFVVNLTQSETDVLGDILTMIARRVRTNQGDL
jgi:hypothetical protein